MGETLKKLLIFIAGGAVGVAASWQFFKNKYARIANEEIESVKETFSNRVHDEESEVTEENDIQNEERKKQHEQRVAKVIEYKKLADNYRSSEDKEGDKIMFVNANPTNGPYVIRPEEFGTNDEYDIISLEYYADKVLVDEDDNPIEDVDYLVGEDSLEHFGEYEEDSVFVRNDELKTDFEILLVEDTYYDEDMDDDQ